jgi:uncharacterized protein (DUF433 family)
MVTLPTNQYVNVREGGYYLPGTRIGLDALIHAFRRGETPEQILKAYPAIGCLANVYGAIAFILEHPEAVEAYLLDQERLWKELREKHPLPQHMLDRVLEARKTRV